jgi:hypothetical protein
MIKVTPFETYKTYLSIKSHFTNRKYDFFKYGGKSRASVESFNKRRDKYFFEKTSRKMSDEEIIEYFVSNFVASDNPSNVWIGEIINSGERNYTDWKRRQQSMSYLFKEESEKLFENEKLDDIFDCSKTHPVLLKKFLGGSISPETMVIYDKIFRYSSDFDKKILDPVWETVSLKIKKYSSFLNIDVFQYKKILRRIINV